MTLVAGRVELRRPSSVDEEWYLAALRRSYEHISQWNPVSLDPADYRQWLVELDSGYSAGYWIVDREDGELAGVANVFNIIRRRFQNGVLSYNAFLPYAGSGRMSEGMQLVVQQCFARPPQGLGLHRLEVNVQPDNERSIALVRRLGFRYEGHARRMLFINGDWRDHERYASTMEEHTS